jgi:hypothetical protein
VEEVSIKIRGLSPLIVKRLSEKTTEQLINKQAKASPVAKAARDPEQDYLDSLYTLPGSPPAGTKGAVYGFPASGIRKSVCTAASMFLRSGQKFSTAFISGSLFVLEDAGGLVRIQHGKDDPVMRSDQGRNPNARGAAVVIHRGCFNEWSLDLRVRYNSSVLSLEQVATLFAWGGFSVGIGEWRPEKSGCYGQYSVVLG